MSVKERFRQAIYHREYRVPFPNSLWHIDGYHKLIRWKIVIHGGVDGYSRIPVNIVASDNNKATTVMLLKELLENMASLLGYGQIKVVKMYWSHH